jgi:hypothetical protein
MASLALYDVVRTAWLSRRELIASGDTTLEPVASTLTEADLIHGVCQV